MLRKTLSFIIPTSARLATLGLLLAADSAAAQAPAATVRPSGNPIIKTKYTADPAALVQAGTVYLYTGHDVTPPPRKSATRCTSGSASPRRTW